MYIPKNDSIERPISNYITLRMEYIFSSLDAIVSKKNDDNTVELYFTYNGQPVSSLDYTFYDEENKGSFYNAKGGHGLINLPDGYNSKMLHIRYE